VIGIRTALVACIAMCVLAGVASALRGSDKRKVLLTGNESDETVTDVSVAR